MKEANVKKPNQQYSDTQEMVQAVRDSTEGEVEVKSRQKRKTYLPDPFCTMQDKNEAKARYKRYVNSAEYDEIPSQTLDSICGSVFRKPVDYSEMNQSLAIMEQDADGDGLTMNELLKIGLSELMMMRYFGMLVEYTNVSPEEAENISVADAESMGLRPSIKLYPRESIIDWEYRQVNNRLTLSYVVLKQSETELNPDTGKYEKANTYLVLSLDNDGFYYQEKFIDLGEKGYWTTPVYPFANGNKWTSIPFEMCIADNLPQGQIPKKLGYLSAICMKTLARYRTSADMKECLYLNGCPMTYSSGWDQASVSLYKEMTGRDYICASPGAHLPIPQGGTVGIMSWNMESSAFEAYMTRNESEIRALGGKFDTTEANADQETATKAIIRAADKNGGLSNAVGNLETSVNRCLGYAAEYVGSDDSGSIKLNREFYTATLTPQERSNIVSEWQTGLISTQEALRQLEKGGILTVTAEALLKEIETSGI